MALTINIRHLEEKDLHLQGKVEAVELELPDADELIHFKRPLEYDLTARLVGRDVLLGGKLEMELDCECARCLKPFVLPICVPDWLLDLPGEGPEKTVLTDDVVDLTPFLREAILLEFPQHPLCDSQCAGLPRKAMTEKEGASQKPETSAWAELNKLKF